VGQPVSGGRKGGGKSKIKNPEKERPTGSLPGQCTRIRRTGLKEGFGRIGKKSAADPRDSGGVSGRRDRGNSKERGLEMMQSNENPENGGDHKRGGGEGRCFWEGQKRVRLKTKKREKGSTTFLEARRRSIRSEQAAHFG